LIDSETLLRWLSFDGIRQFVGVPDSLLKPLLSAIDGSQDVQRHVIAANEGAAVGYAIGAYLESGAPAAVYMQNSGLGNAINPLTALAHQDVYGTPMVLIIGWRGEPGTLDEPQHMVTGSITTKLLELAGIPYAVLDSDESAARDQIKKLWVQMTKNLQPVAILVRSGILTSSRPAEMPPETLPLSREAGLGLIAGQIPEGARVIATTGMLGRELWELRKETGASTDNDFMVAGGMGHASAIAHGVAEANPAQAVWCLDGDGSLLMHLGTAAVIGHHKPSNLKHVLFNNFSHDSVGGQPTAATTISFEGLARSLGYKWRGSASSADELLAVSKNLSNSDGPAIIEVQIRRGARSDLGRPPSELFARGTRFRQHGAPTP
jgi:phosphonopyruvate decarboxylase